MQAIDVHTHVLPWSMLKPVVDVLKKRSMDLQSSEHIAEDPSKLLQAVDDANVERTCVIGYTSPEVMGLTESVNDFTIDYCAKYPGRLLPFGSPGVNQPEKAVKDSMNRLIDRGIRGIKIHPCHQLVYPHEYKTGGSRALEVIFSIAQAEHLPVMIHTGTSIFPRSINRFADLIYVDDVAEDFPQLKIILAHGGRPIWMSTAFFLVRRHENVFLDISGIPPRSLLEYFPRVAEIAEKTMFGSDWPGPDVRSIKSNIADILSLPLSGAAKRLILRETASKVLGA
ncbi:MAG: amidohydrolase family protein [Thaumarchaeota archaeon]|nr:amidohydrolase family protein [Nitrososphaerota archaeon]